MFVRWKRSRGRKPQGWGDMQGQYHYVEPILWRASLMRSVRRDGKPRQEVVCYLGSIQNSCIDAPQFAATRDRFWRNVDWRLERAGIELDQATRERAWAALAAVVPRLTPDELAEEQRKLSEARAFLGQLRR